MDVDQLSDKCSHGIGSSIDPANKLLQVTKPL